MIAYVKVFFFFFFKWNLNCISKAKMQGFVLFTNLEVNKISLLFSYFMWGECQARFPKELGQPQKGRFLFPVTSYPTFLFLLQVTASLQHFFFVFWSFITSNLSIHHLMPPPSLLKNFLPWNTDSQKVTKSTFPCTLHLVSPNGDMLCNYDAISKPGN